MFRIAPQERREAEHHALCGPGSRARGSVRGSWQCRRMPRLAHFDEERLARVLRRQLGVIARRQAVACAMTDKAIRYRTRPGGPWTTVLPGIYAVGQRVLTGPRRAVAAYLYPPKAIAVTGRSAIGWHGISPQPAECIDVLVPRASRQADAGFVRLHRTTITPGAFCEDGVVRYVPADRAIVDAARQLGDLSDVRALVAAGVQRGKVLVWQLARELDAGPIPGSARLRLALAEVADGVRSTAEADLRSIIRQARLPEPLYNPKLYIGAEFLAMPDVWWPDHGVAAEADSKQWHLSPADWANTTARHDRMTAAGILVLHFPPSQLKQEGWQVARQLKATLAAARGPLPQIVTIPAA
jgi:hypothetical protein